VNASRLAPELSAQEWKRMARRTFINFFEAASDLFRLPSLRPDQIQAMITAEGMEHLHAAQALGRGVIVVTPHLGPYELGGAYVASLGLRVHAMVEDIDPETNAALASYRGAAGMKLISRSAGLRQMYRLLKEGQIVLLVADRVIGEGTEGIDVSWGAGRRPVPSGPAAFALATGAPIVSGYIVRRPAGSPTRYLLHLDAPIVATGLSRDDLTRDVAARLADAVCQHPDQWYVFQPDWQPRDASA
jgi:KDO2-lipid IV(A) lauroyltransferase